MNKRYICLLLTLLLAVSMLAGCADTAAPTETELPTSAPTQKPTEEPTQAPTQPPTEAPTEAPTEPPTEAPTEPAEKLGLSEASLTLTKKGETMSIYCGEVPLENVSWFSDDESIAIFSQGSVICINQGTTVVYAKFQNQTVSCEVTCDVNPEDYLPYLNSDLMHAPRLAPPIVDMEDTSFFDDAAFIGDSASYVLERWNLKTGAFGNAVFLTRSSLGLQNSLDGRMKLFYQNREYDPGDALAVTGVKKVFIMLGFNDIGLFGVDGTMERWELFVNGILEKCPDIEIYIQSCTAVHSNGAYPGYDNETFDEYNVRLQAFCEENGYHFVNIAPYFKDFTNGMPTRYSSDYFVHMTYEGTAAWEKVLKAYAAEQAQGESE